MTTEQEKVEPSAASLPHSIAQNAIEWGTRKLCGPPAPISGCDDGDKSNPGHGRPDPKDPKAANNVNKTYPKTVNCNTNAAGLMQQVEANFSSFGNYNGLFGPLGVPIVDANVTFGTGSATPVSQGGTIPINLQINGGNHNDASGVEVNVSVTVVSVSSTSFTFSTNQGHVLYPATITFSASDAGNQAVNFSIQVNGTFSGLGSEIGYYMGGNSLENGIWSHFEKNVQSVCAGTPTSTN